MKKASIALIIIASMALGVAGCGSKTEPEVTAAPGESAVSEAADTTDVEEKETEAETEEPAPLVIDDWTEYFEQSNISYDDLDQQVEKTGDFITELTFAGADAFAIDAEHEWIRQHTYSKLEAVPMFDPGTLIEGSFKSSDGDIADYGYIFYYPFDGGDYIYNEDGSVVSDTLVWNDGFDSFLTTGNISDYIIDNGDGSFSIMIEDDHDETESGVYTIVMFNDALEDGSSNWFTIIILIGVPEAGEAPIETPAAVAGQYSIGDTINEEFMEMTIDGVVEEQEVEPSDTSGAYTYYSDQEDETYVIVYGTLKNLAGNDLELSGGTSIEFCFDDKYNYYGWIEVEENDGTGFDSWLKPLASRNYVLYASVPDELIDMYTSCTISFKCSENMEWSYDYEYSYDIVFEKSDVS